MIQLSVCRRLSGMNPNHLTDRRARRFSLLRVTLAAVLTGAAAIASAVPDETLDGAGSGLKHADAERARESVRKREYIPLEQIVADAQRRHPGRIIEVELEGNEYEIELLKADGVRVELEYDARDGRLLEVEYDD